MSFIGSPNISENEFILNFAPTGIIPTKQMNPHTPLAPGEIIQDVLTAEMMGASIAHIHARDKNGHPTRDPEVYKRIIGGIREQSQSLVICVSLSSRIADGFDRLSPLKLGDEKPDMASLTVGSANLPTGTTVNTAEDIATICGKLAQLGIKPEIEAFEPGMLEFCNYLIRKKMLTPPLYCNIFFGARGASGLNAANIAAFERSAPPRSVLCAAGIGRFHKRSMSVGVALFNGVRVGLEDCPYKDYKERTPVSNTKLVKDVVDMAKLLGRTPISAKKLRGVLDGSFPRS
jgi:uncharacterized protein (DUF849 family)